MPNVIIKHNSWTHAGLAEVFNFREGPQTGSGHVWLQGSNAASHNPGKSCDNVSAHSGKDRSQVNCLGLAVSVHVIPSPSRCSSIHSHSTDGQSNPLPVMCNEGQEGERIFDMFKYYPKQRNRSKARDAFK